jgi:hypothetical protein
MRSEKLFLRRWTWDGDSAALLQPVGSDRVEDVCAFWALGVPRRGDVILKTRR